MTYGPGARKKTAQRTICVDCGNDQALVSIEDAIAAIPKGWLLHVAQRENDWSASLIHSGTAWCVSGSGGTLAGAIAAVSARVVAGRLTPEIPPELLPAYSFGPAPRPRARRKVVTENRPQAPPFRAG